MIVTVWYPTMHRELKMNYLYNDQDHMQFEKVVNA